MLLFRSAVALGLLVLSGWSAGAVANELVIHELPIFDPRRLELTAEYSRVHYGRDSAQLETPRMIVIHYTTLPILEASLAFFRPTLLSRTDIRSGGAVNVSAHYLVDKDGTIYRLAADDVLCRHIIGFNHVALGIENVARDQHDLTPAQLAANAALIDHLRQRHPTIAYLLGHHEYQDRSRPHFALHRDDDASYRPTLKHDPGVAFMAQLRARLKTDYGLTLRD